MNKHSLNFTEKATVNESVKKGTLLIISDHRLNIIESYQCLYFHVFKDKDFRKNSYDHFMVGAPFNTFFDEENSKVYHAFKAQPLENEDLDMIKVESIDAEICLHEVSTFIAELLDYHVGRQRNLNYYNWS